MASVWGPLVSPLDVEDAIKATLQTWIDSALTEVERLRTGLAIRELPRPVRWEAVDDIEDIEDWKDRDLPAVVVETAADAPENGNSGAVNSQMAFTVTTLWRGSSKHVDREKNRATIIHLQTAVKWVLWKRPDLGGVASALIVGATSYDFAPPARPRTLSGAQTEILVVVDDIANRWGIPNAPDAPAPTEPPEGSPEWPEHTETNVSVTDLS